MTDTTNVKIPTTNAELNDTVDELNRTVEYGWHAIRRVAELLTHMQDEVDALDASAIDDEGLESAVTSTHLSLEALGELITLR